MPYRPANGDLVNVVRTKPGGAPRTCCTGVLSFLGDTFTPDTGFAIDGCGSHASASTLLRCHGVVQDVQSVDPA